MPNQDVLNGFSFDENAKVGYSPAMELVCDDCKKPYFITKPLSYQQKEAISLVLRLCVRRQIP